MVLIDLKVGDGSDCFERGKGVEGYYNSLSIASPLSSRSAHSRLHPFIFARTPLRPSVVWIHRRKASSSLGMKNDDRSESIVSKFASGEVMLSVLFKGVGVGGAGG